MLYVNTWFLSSHVTGHIISVGAEVVDFLYGFVRDSAAKSQAVMRNRCWFLWDRKHSKPWMTCSSGKVGRIWQGQKQQCWCQGEANPSQETPFPIFGVPETCLIPKPCLHTKASQSKRFSLTDIAGIILLFPLRGCIFHDSICKLSSNDNLELQIYKWLMGIQPYSQPHQLDALVSLQQDAEALFLHCKPQCSHTLQQCWWFHFPL